MINLFISLLILDKLSDLIVIKISEHRDARNSQNERAYKMKASKNKAVTITTRIRFVTP